MVRWYAVTAHDFVYSWQRTADLIRHRRTPAYLQYGHIASENIDDIIAGKPATTSGGKSA